jgi:purine-cytosine permease-like protein
MDLITRGAGFGYFGGSVTSLIYASFTFIFFALEGSIMAQAFNVGFGLPLVIGYVVASLVIIPLVVFGMTLLSKLQVWTQPVWLVLMFAPFVYVGFKDPGKYAAFTHWGPQGGSGASSGWASGSGWGWRSPSSPRSANRSTTCGSCRSRRHTTPSAGGPR